MGAPHRREGLTLAAPRYLTVRRSAPEELEATLRTLITSGSGWVNLRPDLDEADVPPVPSSLGRLFSGRGPAVPMATFVAGRAGKAHLLGIEHGSGPKAAGRLVEAGVRAPTGSKIKADHGRRGLVVMVPTDAEPGAIARFLLDGAATLSAVVVGDDWEAEIYSG